MTVLITELHDGFQLSRPDESGTRLKLWLPRSQGWTRELARQCADIAAELCRRSSWSDHD